MRLDSIPPTQRTILVVEDERIVARDLQLSLGQLGYRVPVTVASADEAIQVASSYCPDLVLMDVRIKGDVDGIEAAHWLRTRFGVPVVYLTAYADDVTLSRAKRTEPYGYLLKPVKIEELRSAVEIALYKHSTDRRLRDRERWFSTTLRSIGDAVISTDDKGHVTFMNPVAEELTGWSAQDANGRALADVVRLFDERTRAEIESPVTQAMQQGGVVRVDASLQSKQGQARSVVDASSPILDEGGGLMGAVVVLQDVSEQRQLRLRAELSDRMTSLGTLAAGVAHEINNPLSAVMTNLQVSLTELQTQMTKGAVIPPWEQEMRASLGEALEAARQIKDIVADMLAFSRPVMRQTQWVDVKPVAEWALRMTSHELSSRARVVIDISDKHMVAADETRLGQVLVNLLINAAHAIAPGRPQDNEVRVCSRSVGDRIVIEVSDTGVGMSEETQRRMFEPFFTTKDVGEGAGLGLAICHGIVKAWGGTFDVRSELGRGSSFCVDLPSASSGAGVSDEPPLLALTVPPANILVVDDEPLVAHAIERALGHCHHVTTAESGEAALARLRAGERFDLVLCDVTMPRLNGLDVGAQCAELDAAQAERFVWMTGGTYSPHTQELLERSGRACLAKPFDPQELTATVVECLATFSARDATA